MIDESKILEYAQELIPEKEDDKPEEEVKEIIRRYLIEKGVTQHLTENQIRAIVRQYLIDEGILIPPKPDIDPEPTPGKLFPTLVIHSSSQDRSITVGSSKTYSIDVTSDGVLSVSSSSPTVATVTRSGNSITVTGIASGNAMAQIPLVWVYRYEDEEYEYEIISDVQYDDNYHAYAHTRADGSIADYFYISMFAGSLYNTNQIRSLSGQTQSVSQDAETEIIECKQNGTANWYTHTWSQRELIRTLLILLGKSTNISAVFGDGTSSMFTTGTLVKKGQFFGCNDGSKEVKVFHMEKFWGGRYDRVAGVFSDSGDIYVKMTPEDAGYKIDDVIGYSYTNIIIPYSGGYTNGYITETKCTKYGLIPVKSENGQKGTYYDGNMDSGGYDINYLVTAGTNYLGAMNFELNYGYNASSSDLGCSLSCEMPAA